MNIHSLRQDYWVPIDAYGIDLMGLNKPLILSFYLVLGVPAPHGLPVQVVQRQREDEQLLRVVRMCLLLAGGAMQASAPSRAHAQHLAAGTSFAQAFSIQRPIL